ncbi:putative oxidoreductase YqkF [Toxocara canis]|uniref:Putative oxidoreductase YqkF n=1 Tax=Toxocara canis TaxID=6265 RepID=A0A0B2UT38_TOXCA|nr:putative oxidoreductase YqkF [Toxocara canis]
MQSHTLSRVRGVPIRFHTSRLRQSEDIPDDQSGDSVPMPFTFVPRFHNEESVRRMRYKRLGSTDMFISRIAFGCGPIGGLFGNVEDSITQILECAIKSGINFIDTAYWYGQGRSEEILGKVLSKIPRKAYYISTKVGRFELDYARTFDFRSDKILQDLTTSLKKLRLPYVDICFVQIHDVEFDPNENIILYETLPALEIAKHSGKIRYIGLTGYPLRKLASVVENSTVRVDVVMTYCHASLNDNALGEYVKFFESKNIGLLNGSPLSMGLLTEKGPPPWHPASPTIRQTCLAAIQYCSSKKIPVEKLAIDYAINYPGVCSCIVGMDSVEQVLKNIETACTELREVEQRLRDRIMRRYFDQLENANWENVDVHSYWKRLKALGLTALATNRHSSVESLASTMSSFSLS